MMSHAVSWLNIAGIIAGLSGGVMTYHFGLPNISVLSSGSYTALEVTPQIRRYQALSKSIPIKPFRRPSGRLVEHGQRE